MAVSIREVAEKRVNASYGQLYEQLNDGQRKAVDALEGPVMVLAGPGTGKTQVLAMRIANILQTTQMDPWNILCLTFTDSAVSAMRNRLISIIGDAAYHVHINTFHSFCNDVIQDHPEFFAQNSQWQVLSDVERVSVMRKLIDGLSGTSALKPFGYPYMYLSDCVQNIQWLKKEGITDERLKELIDGAEDFVDGVEDVFSSFFGLNHAKRTDLDCLTVYEEGEKITISLGVKESIWPQFETVFDRYQEAQKLADGKREAGKARTAFKNEMKKIFDGMKNQLPKQKELLKLYGEYQKELNGIGRYDYEDMIMHVLERLKSDDSLLAKYQELFQYILVDEYQDTNGAQNEVVRLLGSFYPDPNIFVVGDDKQSIFRFQGASLENLLSFYEHYEKDVKVVSLKNNYRSHQAVLDAAGAVIENNTALIEKVIPDLERDLEAMQGDPRPIEGYVFDTEDEEDYFVANKIHQLLSEGVEASEIAVLYRFNRDVDGLLDVMLRKEIPVHVAAGDNVLRDRRVRQLLSILQYVDDGQRDDVLVDIMQYDFWGLNALDALKLVNYAGRNRQSVLDVITSEFKMSEAGVKDSKVFIEFAEKLAGWRVLAGNDTLQKLFDEVLQKSGLLQAILDDEEQLLILNRITTVFTELRRLNQADSNIGVKEFIERINLLDEHGLPLISQGWKTMASSVQLMSAHRAKGLEFKHVFMIRLVDKHWGNVRERKRLSLPLGVVKHDPVMGQENNEDERRLFYVGLTRAKEQLYLSHSLRDGGGKEQVESLFLREVPVDMIKEKKVIETDQESLERLSSMRLAWRKPEVAVDVREWLLGQIENYVMSVTHLNNYLECPRLFYFRNLIKVPSAKTRHMSFGTAVHNALRDIFARINEDGKVPDVEYLVGQFNFFLDREVLSDADRKDSRALGEDVMREYYANYVNSFATDTLLEFDFNSQGVHLDDLRLTGKLDKIEVLDRAKKLVNVVDYKTGNPDSAGSKLRKGGPYRRQLVFYKLLIDLSPRFDFEMLSAELDFVQSSGKTGKYIKKRLEISEEEVEELKSEIRQAWKDIKSLSFLEEDGCGVCEYCTR